MRSNAYKNIVHPALKSIVNGEAIYRCERDLHHHLTSLFVATFQTNKMSLELGSLNPRIKYEHPTVGKYRWLQGEGDERSGNVDLYFSPTQKTDEWNDCKGIAIEVNYNYDDVAKITRDIFKLIDPVNRYVESVYVACARKPHFHERIMAGVAQAIEWVQESEPTFCLPSGLIVFALSEHGGNRDWRIYSPNEAPNDSLKKIEGDFKKTSTCTPDILGELITKEEAKKRLANAMNEAGIPSNSITAKCMFEATTNRKGECKCRLGSTPLWENEMQLVGEAVLDSHFEEWTSRLVGSGRSYQ